MQYLTLNFNDFVLPEQLLYGGPRLKPGEFDRLYKNAQILTLIDAGHIFCGERGDKCHFVSSDELSDEVTDQVKFDEQFHAVLDDLEYGWTELDAGIRYQKHQDFYNFF